MLETTKSLLLACLPRDSFARHVSVLASGTAIAQAIPIAVSPILTRLYGPEEFGLVALYLSCVTVISVIATARYELAITLPETDEDAAHVVTLTLKICLFVSLFLYIPIFFFGRDIAQLLGNSELVSWFYLLPVSVIMTGAFHAFQYWRNRRTQYRKMSTNRIQNAAFKAFSNVILGLAQTKGGMIFGNTLGQSLATVTIGRSIWQKDREVFIKVSSQREVELAKRYANHPKHIAPAQLIGVVAQQIPIFMIGALYSMATVGFFSMAYRLVSLPSALIANAIGDVYRQRISVAYNERGEFRDIFVKTLTKTTFFSAPPFIILFFVSPPLFELVFGPSWRVAGEYAQILVAASFFQFIFTPIDKGAVVVGATSYILIWHALRLTAMIFLFLSATQLNLDVESILWLFVLINTSLYFFDGVMEYRYATEKST